MARHAPVCIALLNDHPLVVEGLRAMLEPYDDRVNVADVSGDAPVGATVDIVLYDAYGTAARDDHWSHFLGAGWSPRYVVLYTWESSPTPPTGRSEGDPPALELSKRLDGLSLVEALEQIHETGAYDAPGPGGDDDGDTARDADPGDGLETVRTWPGKAEGLTERESEIVFLIVEGLSNHELAERLFLGINTVKTYIRSAYRRMGVDSRSKAVLWGIDHGFRRQRPPY